MHRKVQVVWAVMDRCDRCAGAGFELCCVVKTIFFRHHYSSADQRASTTVVATGQNSCPWKFCRLNHSVFWGQEGAMCRPQLSIEFLIDTYWVYCRLHIGFSMIFAWNTLCQSCRWLLFPTPSMGTTMQGTGVVEHISSLWAFDKHGLFPCLFRRLFWPGSRVLGERY